MALKKVDGVSSVNVTLKRGVAHLARDVTGTSTSLVLAEDPAAPGALAAAPRAETAPAQVPAEVVGTVAWPAGGEKGEQPDDTVLVRSFTTSR